MKSPSRQFFRSGALSLTLGILNIIFGVTVGVLNIVSGAIQLQHGKALR